MVGIVVAAKLQIGKLGLGRSIADRMTGLSLGSGVIGGAYQSLQIGGDLIGDGIGAVGFAVVIVHAAVVYGGSNLGCGQGTVGLRLRSSAWMQACI